MSAVVLQNEPGSTSCGPRRGVEHVTWAGNSHGAGSSPVSPAVAAVTGVPLAGADLHAWIALRRVSFTSTGHARYQQLRGTPGRSGLPVPDPQFPTPKTPAGRRASCPAPLPAPDGQPDPHHPGAGIGQLRWARSPERRLHLLHPTEVIHATEGHGTAVCGHPVTAQGLTITSGPPGALCLTCLALATSPTSDPRPGITTPGGSLMPTTPATRAQQRPGSIR